MNAIISSFRELTTVLLLAASCCSPVRADWCHAGEKPSLEWLVDASNVVMGEVVEGHGFGCVVRVTEIPKRSKLFTVKVGDVVECKVRLRLPGANWGKNEPVVAFFGNDTTQVRSVVNLTRPDEVRDRSKRRYLAVDEHGKIVLDREQFMRRIRARIESNAASQDGSAAAREDGFEYFPKVCEIDGDSEYYSLRVPPDPCFREMLEETANRFAGYLYVGNCIWAQSALYKFYSSYTDEQRKEHRKKTVRGAVEFARTRYVPGGGLFTVRNFYSYSEPGRWFGKVSTGGRHLALLAGETVELHDLFSGDMLYMSEGIYVHRGRELSVVFAADGKHFAHLQANGDVTLFDVTRKEVKQTFEFTWEPQSNLCVWAFSFSPDGRYLALLVHSDESGGCALQVWSVESGKTVLKPSDGWRTQFRIAGFSPDSKLLKVQAVDYDARVWKPVNQVWDLETGRLSDDPLAGEWRVPAAPENSHLPFGRDSGHVPPRAETLDGKLQAEVVPGKPQRLVIREAESGKIVRSLDLAGKETVSDVTFSSGGDAVFLVIGRCSAVMFPIDVDTPRPAWFGCWH